MAFRLYRRAKLRLLAANQVCPESGDLAHRRYAHESISSAGPGLAQRGAVPFDVAEKIVDRPFRISLSASSPDDSDIRAGVQEPSGLAEPSLNHLAIAIDEENIRQIGLELQQSLEPFVSGPRGRKRPPHVELENFHARGAGQGHRAVARSRVHIDQAARIAGQGGETALESLSFVAANDYDTTPGKDISAELDRLHKSHLLKIYPVIGKTSADGHSLLYLGISEWEPDVFRFLDDTVKH